MDLVQTIIATAKSYIGQEETKGNSGFKNNWFQTLMVKIGWLKGQSWCAYFAKNVWAESFKLIDPIGYKMILKYANGSALQTYYNFAKSKEFHVQNNPTDGALVIFQDGNGSFGHEGVVTSFTKDDFMFVSGNTGKLGEREGTTVLEKSWSLDKPFNAKSLNLLGFVVPTRIL